MLLCQMPDGGELFALIWKSTMWYLPSSGDTFLCSLTSFPSPAQLKSRCASCGTRVPKLPAKVCPRRQPPVNRQTNAREAEGRHC